MAVPFPHGELYAPHYIFVRGAGRLSDAGLLHLFGLEGYRPTQPTHRLGRYAVLADSGEWTLLADDWCYTLWNMPSTTQAVYQIAQTCDVFTCFVGDTDQSFAFAYYRDGRVARRYTVDDPHWRGRVVTEDVGEPLPGEEAAFQEADESRLVLAVAASLGLRTRYTPQDARVYAPPERA